MSYATSPAKVIQFPTSYRPSSSKQRPGPLKPISDLELARGMIIRKFGDCNMSFCVYHAPGWEGYEVMVDSTTNHSEKSFCDAARQIVTKTKTRLAR